MKGKLLGPQGQNVKHISLVTGAKVQLRGRGASQNPEADGPEDMHLEINASSEISMKQALELAFNLVETIRQEYVASVTQPLQSTQSNMYNVSGVQRAAGQSYPPQYPTAPYTNTLPAPGPFIPPHRRPIAIAATMQHTVTQSPHSHASTTPIPPSKGCVPFVYPDGDAVIRPSSSKLEPSNAPSSTPPVAQISTATGESFPARLSLNGSTFAVVRPKEVTSSSRSSSNSSSSSSGSDNHGRSGDDSSNSGSNKRRRGFKESAVYTSTSDNPIPTSMHQNNTADVKVVPIADSVLPNGLRGSRLQSESDSGNGAVPSVTRDNKGSMGVETEQKTYINPSPQGNTSSSSSSAVFSISEPAPSVVSALAAMTERRMQNKARPLVPVFSMSPSFSPSPLSSGSTSPSLSNPRPQSSSSGTLPGGTPNKASDAISLAPAASAVTFKLPGLTAYDDDDEDD